MNPSRPARRKVASPARSVFHASKNFAQPALPWLPPLGHSLMSMNVMMIQRIQCMWPLSTCCATGRYTGAQGATTASRNHAPASEPTAVIIVPSKPRPAMRYFWPGSTVKSADSSGVPSRTAGIVFTTDQPTTMPVIAGR